MENTFEKSKMEVTKNEPPVDLGNGQQIYLFSRGSFAAQIAFDVKTDDPYAIETMAAFLAEQVHEDCILIPAPQSTGEARYTLQIVNIMKELLDSKYDVEICNTLKSAPRDSLFMQKRHAQDAGEDFSKIFTGIYLNGQVDESGKKIYFVDNHFQTGKTFFDVKELIPSIKPLIWSVSKKAFDLYKSLV